MSAGAVVESRGGCQDGSVTTGIRPYAHCHAYTPRQMDRVGCCDEESIGNAMQGAGTQEPIDPAEEAELKKFIGDHTSDYESTCISSNGTMQDQSAVINGM